MMGEAGSAISRLTFVGVTLLFVLFGTGVLFPWDAFVTAYDWFASMYPDFPFEFVLTLCFQYPSVLFLILAVRFGRNFSFASRIFLFYGLDLVALIVVPFLPGCTASLVVTFILVGCTGASTAVLMGTVTGLAAVFDSKYITGIMVGQGVAGIIVSLIRVVTKATIPTNYNLSGILYFSIAAFNILCCIIGYFIFTRMEMYKSQMHLSQKPKQGALIEGAQSVKVSNKVVFKKIWKQALNVFLVFFLTLSLFPGLTTDILPQQASLGDWFQVILISIFMGGDWLGRTLPVLGHHFPARWLWVLVLARLLFFPLFAMFTLQLLPFDWLVYTSMSVFAISNGYLSTLAMVYGPASLRPGELAVQAMDAAQLRHLAQEEEAAGLIMSFALQFGIFCAAHFAVVLRYIVEGKFF